MGRPQKQTVSYFPHDANASTSDTLAVLQSRFGNDGYAFWFKLLEKLAASEGHYVDCRNPIKWQLLLVKTGVNEITGVEIMKLLVEMQAIDKDLWDTKLIWCQNLVENIKEVYKNRRREIPQKPVSTNNNGISTNHYPITTSNLPVESTQSKVEYSRVNKIDDGDTQKTNNNTIQLMVYEKHRLRVPVAWWATLKAEFSDLDIDAELKKFGDHWYGGKRKLKNVRLALRNWFTKAREIKARNNSGKQLPTTDKLKQGWG